VQRVAVLGPAGSGKTELANRLGERTGLPVVHLDLIFWSEGWQPAPGDEAAAELERVVAQERWIIDGDFIDHRGRFARADTVVFLDVPRWKCIVRVLRRRVRDRNVMRPDLPAPESFDWELIKWIWRYPRAETRALATVVLHDPEQWLTSTASSSAAE
jgi:adenylate kinase family enzyme